MTHESIDGFYYSLNDKRLYLALIKALVKSKSWLRQLML